MESNGDWSFDDEWPRIADGLQRALYSKGVPTWLRDDVVQETGLRLLRMWDRVDRDRSPEGLALTIARQVMWRESRRRTNVEVVGAVPDLPDLCDVESAGLARVELGRVRTVLPRLKEAHRRVLLAEIGERPALDGSRDAVKMLRMRARKRLSALLEQASAHAGTIVLELRLFASRVLDAARRSGSGFESQGLAITAGVLALAAMLAPSTRDAFARPDPPGEQLRRRSTTESLSGGTRNQDSVDRATGVRRDRRSSDGRHHIEGRRRDRESDEPRGGERERHYSVAVGDGGAAEGEVQLRLSSEEEDERAVTERHPSCDAGESGGGFEASCKVSTKSRQVKAKVRVRVRTEHPTERQETDNG